MAVRSTERKPIQEVLANTGLPEKFDPRRIEGCSFTFTPTDSNVTLSGEILRISLNSSISLFTWLVEKPATSLYVTFRESDGDEWIAYVYGADSKIKMTLKGQLRLAEPERLPEQDDPQAG